MYVCVYVCMCVFVCILRWTCPMSRAPWELRREPEKGQQPSSNPFQGARGCSTRRPGGYLRHRPGNEKSRGGSLPGATALCPLHFHLPSRARGPRAPGGPRDGGLAPIGPSRSPTTARGRKRRPTDLWPAPHGVAVCLYVCMNV